MDLSKQRDGHKTSRFYGPFAASLPSALTPILTQSFLGVLALGFQGSVDESSCQQSPEPEWSSAWRRVPEAVREGEYVAMAFAVFRKEYGYG